MFPSTARLAAVRTPLIKFLGPRSAIKEVHHPVTRHPAAPRDADYPLKAAAPAKASPSKPNTQGASNASRNNLDFTQLPLRYRRPQLTEAEIEAVETGGATMIY